MTDKIEINGFCEPQFQKVKDIFRKNFEDNLEVGACCALAIDGKLVVDLWGGYADAAKTKPWKKNSIVNVYSSTKVMTALCIHILVDRGLIDVEEPVARYWPEFAQNGKDKLPVKYLMSHSAGLQTWVPPITTEEGYNWDRACSLLAVQKPSYEPGTQCTYHAVTFGFLLGELVRRITGKSLGTFFREEIAEKIDSDFHIGFSEEHDSRVAELIPPITPPELFNLMPKEEIEQMEKNNIKAVAATKTREWRQAESPASNGHGNARSMARIGSIVACGGSLEGINFLSRNTLEKAIEEQIYKQDSVLMRKQRYGLGWGLPSLENPVTPNWEDRKACYW